MSVDGLPKQSLKDIRLWIVVFFLIRLIGITNPPLETGHNWRQSLTGMITRNFSETGWDVFHPRIDMAGEHTGIIGSEFPLFNSAVFLLNEVFGFTHWYGRLLSLLVSSFGLWFFYLLIKKHFKEKTAFYSTLLLAASIWFSYSRKNMPDVFSISLAVSALYFWSRYLDRQRISDLFLYGLLMAFGTLSKLPAILWITPVMVHVLTGNASRAHSIKIVIATAIAVTPALLWYFYWVPELVSTYRYQLYFPKSIPEGISEISEHIPGLLKNFYFHAFCSYSAFILTLIGAWHLIRKGTTTQKATALSMTLIFALFIIKTGSVFPLHNYYIIPAVPAMALLAGWAISRLSGKAALLITLVVIAESLLNQQHDFFIKENQRYKMQLEQLTNEHVPKNDRIIINGGQNPQLMYLAHRKGWTLSSEQLRFPGTLDSIANLGGKYLVVDKTDDLENPAPFMQIFENEYFRICRLPTP